MALIPKTVITRAGTPRDQSIVSIPLGDQGMLSKDIDESKSILSKSEENPLGLNGLHPYHKCVFVIKFNKIEQASGYDIHGLPINGVVDSSGVWDEDNTCDDGYGESAGEWVFTRGGLPQPQKYSPVT